MQTQFKTLRPNDRRILEKLEKDFADEDFSARSLSEEFPELRVETISVCLRRLSALRKLEVVVPGTRKRGNTYRLRSAASNPHFAGSSK